MGILKTRKNKKFSYNPRYYSNEGEGSPFEIKHKYAWSEMRADKNRSVNRRLIFIIAILVFVFLYIIDFDLSIFFQKL